MIPEIATLKSQISSDEASFKKQQTILATFFKNEIERFYAIKNSTDLSVRELETIAVNASKNYLLNLQNGI